MGGEADLSSDELLAARVGPITSPDMQESVVLVSDIWWTLRDKVPTLPHSLKVLVRVRKQFEARELPKAVDSHMVGSRQLRRLTTAQTADLVEAYRGGKTVFELAEMFGVHRTTVGIILRRQGVATRNSVPACDVAEVARLRSQGWSCRELARRWGVNESTIRNAITHHQQAPEKPR